MATSKAKKESQLDVLTKKFESAQGVAFVKFFGPTVEEVQVIRRSLREKGMSYTVIKKTLIALAAKNAKLADFPSDDLDGAVAVICSDSDEIAPAAEIKKMKKDFFNKETKSSKFDFAGAVFEGKFLGEEDTAILAETPTREESFA
ncbi:MAG: 50S ribosomal protein L10, partial [Candidatus Peregrinibacteria bacterium]|nr:50S ribosomal protein L10 [Candidatus Peregrinibacteria bacterium]